MSASVDSGLGHRPKRTPTGSGDWNHLPTDGSHAWLGLLLMTGSSIVAIRAICWFMAGLIRLLH